MIVRSTSVCRSAVVFASLTLFLIAGCAGHRTQTASTAGSCPGMQAGCARAAAAARPAAGDPVTAPAAFAPAAFGAPITVTDAVSIPDLAANPERFVGRTVRLEGTVAAVCQGMGCWAQVQSADGATFLAKSLDESVLLPRDCAGRKIVVQGVVTALPQQAAPAPVPEGHTCPRPAYLVATSGVELR